MARVRGNVGTSLRSSDAVSAFGKKSAAAGDYGEKKLDRALETSRKTGGYHRWRSLKIPPSASGKRYRSDVDFALANGDTIVLVDAKCWSGGFLWSLSGSVMDGFRRKKNFHGEEQSVGKNMSMAVDLYQQHCDKLHKSRLQRGIKSRRVKVIGLVIFVPTQRGVMPTSVRFLKFSGTKGTYLVDPGVRAVAKCLGKTKYDDNGKLIVNPISVSLLDKYTR